MGTIVSKSGLPTTNWGGGSDFVEWVEKEAGLSLPSSHGNTAACPDHPRLSSGAASSSAGELWIINYCEQKQSTWLVGELKCSTGQRTWTWLPAVFSVAQGSCPD